MILAGEMKCGAGSNAGSGSSPIPSAKATVKTPEKSLSKVTSFLRDRSVVDQEPHKLRVGGSIPSPATNLPTTHGNQLASTDLVGTVARHITRWCAGYFFPVNRRGRRLHRWLAINQSVRRVA